MPSGWSSVCRHVQIMTDACPVGSKSTARELKVGVVGEGTTKAWRETQNGTKGLGLGASRRVRPLSRRQLGSRHDTRVVPAVSSEAYRRANS